jgi:NAD-dependent dihydropyrimidine dehydrogenase PreA subunit
MAGSAYSGIELATKYVLDTIGAHYTDDPRQSSCAVFAVYTGVMRLETSLALNARNLSLASRTPDNNVICLCPSSYSNLQYAKKQITKDEELKAYTSSVLRQAGMSMDCSPSVTHASDVFRACLGRIKPQAVRSLSGVKAVTHHGCHYYKIFFPDTSPGNYERPMVLDDLLHDGAQARQLHLEPFLGHRGVHLLHQHPGARDVRELFPRGAEEKREAASRPGGLGPGEKEGLLVVRVEDTLGGGLTEIETDMVVLSCAPMPSAGTVEVANKLGVNPTPELFVQEKHPRMESTQTSLAGIFVCGTAEGAKDITASINQSRSAASKAVELVSAGAVEVEPKYAIIDPEKCDRCGNFVKLCLYGALYENGRMTIDPLACTGLGECVALCPQQAISLPGSSDGEIYARIDGCLSGTGGRLVAFLDEKIAYVAADNVGVNRIAYPPEVRIVRVPSVMRLESRHRLHAFKKARWASSRGMARRTPPAGQCGRTSPARSNN